MTLRLLVAELPTGRLSTSSNQHVLQSENYITITILLHREI
jgi:hypothetical protein